MPNRRVNRNFCRRLACYPWRTFHPLRDDPSFRRHRITRTCKRPFRGPHTGSACPRRRQAGRCPCAYPRRSLRVRPPWYVLGTLWKTTAPVKLSPTPGHPGAFAPAAKARYPGQAGLSSAVERPREHRTRLSTSRPSPRHPTPSSPTPSRYRPTTSFQSRCTGSSRPAGSHPHRHGWFDFARGPHGTARESLRHSCRTIISGQGISLP